MSRFSTVRTAVWDAIDNWPALATTFKQKYRFQSTVPAGQPKQASDRRYEPTSITECDAISIVPQAFPNEWKLNNLMEFDYALTIKCWFKSATADTAEDVMEKLLDAFWGAKASGAPQSYIRTALGGRIARMLPFTVSTDLIGETGAEDDNRTKVLTLTGGIVLPVTYQPSV